MYSRSMPTLFHIEMKSRDAVIIGSVSIHSIRSDIIEEIDNGLPSSLLYALWSLGLSGISPPPWIHSRLHGVEIIYLHAPPCLSE